MARKTVDVAWLVGKANAFLDNSPDEEVEKRLGVASFLEAALHEAGAYKGFGYIGGYEEGVTDESRRRYYH